MKVLLPIILWFCLCASAWAAAPEELRIGVERQAYLPFYALEDGEYRGYARDLLDAFAAAHGYRLRYVALPVKRLYSDFLSGELDFKFPDHPQWNSELKQGHRLHYSAAVVSFTDGVLLPPHQHGQGQNRIRRLGILLGFTPTAYQDEIRRGRMELSPSTQLDPLLKMAISGRVDGAYLNVQVAEYRLRQLGLEQRLTFDPTLPHSTHHYHLSSLRHPDVIAAFDAFLIEQAAQVSKLKRRYGLSLD